jgi:hypothetical protein
MTSIKRIDNVLTGQGVKREPEVVVRNWPWREGKIVDGRLVWETPPSIVRRGMPSPTQQRVNKSRSVFPDVTWKRITQKADIPEQPIPEELQANRSSVAIIASSKGRPYKGWSFASLFSAEVKKHPELTGLVFHGPRKTAAAKLAEAGCSPHEIAAITGHRSLAMLMLYTAEAEQRTRAKAAVVKLERQTAGNREVSC